MALFPTAAETIATVRSRLRADSATFWTDEDLIEAYNDALDEIADNTECHEIWVNVKRRKWAPYADLRGALPTTALRVTAVWNCVSQKWLDPTTPRELDANVGRGWEEIVDVSRWWFMRGMWFLGAFPVAGDDVSTLRVYCSALMPHVSTAGGLSAGLGLRPPLPLDAATAIEMYMMSSLFSDRGETAKALGYWGDFAVAQKAIKTQHDDRMSRDRRPRMGARR